MMKEKFDDFKSNHEGCNVEDIKKVIKKEVAEYVEEYVDEIEEKKSRKLNIIVSNLPESKEETADDRRREDRERVRGLISKTMDEVNVEEVDSPVRLGQFRIGTNAKPRLLKMTVKTEETKKKIMKNVASLNKNVPFERRVYINDDNTPKEREKIKKLRDELRKRRDDGEENLVINYKELKIVTRSPKIPPNDSRVANGNGPGGERPRSPQTVFERDGKRSDDAGKH